MMDSSSSNDDQRDRREYFLSNAPFNIQVSSSLRDPRDGTFSIEQLQRVGTLDEVRSIALRYLHDDQIFASIWNSDTIHPKTRRWLRKLVQIQTINAVLNEYEEK